MAHNETYTIVSHGICSTVAYFEDGATFSALAPKSAICPWKDSDTSYSTAELSVMIRITMYIGLLFLLIVMYRSCSRIRVDWYRLIFLYIIGTLGFPICLDLGPSYGGFNRVSGFGVMVHNMAELFLLGRIWHGQVIGTLGTKFTVTYVWIILSLLTFLPLSPLFLIAMLQGAFMDWALVMTFLITGVAMQQHDGKYFWFGFAAAATHILSIQPLFFGFSLGYRSLNGITSLFLIPTFIIYTWFASADSNSPPNIISPIATGSGMLAAQRNVELQKIVYGLQESIGDRGSVSNESSLKPRPVAVNINQEKKKDDDNANIRDSVSEQEQEQEQEDEDSARKRVSTLGHVLDNGLLANEKGKKWFWTVACVAAILTSLNSAGIYLGPCYVDTSFICD